MSSKDILVNELVRLASYNNKGYSESEDISQKRKIKTPFKFTHTSTYNKKYTKPQTKIKKEKPNKIEKTKIKKEKPNKIEKTNKKMKTIAIKYFRENAEKYEQYLSQLYYLIYELTDK